MRSSRRSTASIAIVSEGLIVMTRGPFASRMLDTVTLLLLRTPQYIALELVKLLDADRSTQGPQAGPEGDITCARHGPAQSEGTSCLTIVDLITEDRLTGAEDTELG